MLRKLRTEFCKRVEWKTWDHLKTLNDDEFVGAEDEPMTVLMGGVATLHEMAKTLAADRREHPADDLMTALVHAER